MTAPELKPCPFCTEGKNVSTYFDREQGDKWGYASCDACGARGPEVRTNYDRDDNAPWRAKAIAAWNIRADLIPSAALAVPEVAALEKEVLRLKASLWAIGHAAGIETKEDLMQAAIAALRGEGRG